MKCGCGCFSSPSPVAGDSALTPSSLVSGRFVGPTIDLGVPVTGSGTPNGLLVRYANDGTLRWARTIPGTSCSRLEDLEPACEQRCDLRRCRRRSPLRWRGRRPPVRRRRERHHQRRARQRRLLRPGGTRCVQELRGVLRYARRGSDGWRLHADRRRRDQEREGKHRRAQPEASWIFRASTTSRSRRRFTRRLRRARRSDAARCAPAGCRG